MSKPPLSSPWLPAPYIKADIVALQALERGEAEPDQQKRVLKWMIERLCRTYDPSFIPHSDRESDFAEGRRYVGLQLVKLININLANVKLD